MTYATKSAPAVAADLKIGFSDYGRTVDVKLPAASDTADAGKLFGALGAGASAAAGTP